jgi:dinuclear metal center YbgI/SA1388 family protein
LLMTTVGDICRWMNQMAPLRLSEAWDNTGLLLGDPDSAVQRLQTCLTLTPESVTEAERQRADMVLAHHPLPFQPLKSITTLSLPGRLLWRLARAGISVYSPHTAWDSAERGINAMLAERLNLEDVRPLVPHGEQTPALGEPSSDVGAGRIGNLPKACRASELAGLCRQLFPESRTRGVDAGLAVRRVAVACGSGGSLLPQAVAAHCDLFLTGEATFHQCLEAQAAGVSLLMIGHFASERFAMVELAQRLSVDFPAVTSWASQEERDPVAQFL